MADELRGNYSGPVILSTKNFVVQLDDGSKQPIIHDRLMLDVAPESNKGLPPTYAQHEKMTIRYTEANAPSIAGTLGAQPIIPPDLREKPCRPVN